MSFCATSLGMFHKLTYLHYSTYVRMGIVYW